MKTKNSNLSIWKPIGLVFLFISILFSCNNENIEIEDRANEDDVISKNIVMNNIAKNSKVGDKFRDFLVGNNGTTRSYDTSEDVWDLDNIKGISNPSENKYVYMVASKENPDIILGGSSNEENNITTFFIFQKNGELYTLKDDTGKPILDAKIDFEKNEILFVNVYAGTETRASARAWCGVGMAVAGGVAAAFIPVTLGASIGFAACWGLVSSLMC